MIISTPPFGGPSGGLDDHYPSTPKETGHIPLTWQHSKQRELGLSRSFHPIKAHCNISNENTIAEFSLKSFNYSELHSFTVA